MGFFEIFATLFFIFGICVGSFCNVLIYRLPRGESVNFPASHCTSCGKALKFYHNVPIFSWLFLRGKCAFCKEKISFVYPLVELAGGILALLCFWREYNAFLNLQSASILANSDKIAAATDMLDALSQASGSAFSAQMFFNAVVLGLCFICLFALSIIDLRYKAVPDGLLFPATALALAYAAGVLFWQNSWSALINSGYFALGFWLLRAGVSLAMKREAMGSADIFIAAVIGAILPWQLSLAAIYIAAILTLPAYALVRKKGYELAFVPFLSAGLLITYLFDTQILNLIGSLYE